MKLDPLRGHAIAGESPAATALREAKEESCEVLRFDPSCQQLLEGQEVGTGDLYHVRVNLGI
jgi:hypothetical protein